MKMTRLKWLIVVVAGWKLSSIIYIISCKCNVGCLRDHWRTPIRCRKEEDDDDSLHQHYCASEREPAEVARASRGTEPDAVYSRTIFQKSHSASGSAREHLRKDEILNSRVS